MDMTALFTTLDRILIQLFRLTGFTFLDYVLGTFTLALMSVTLGELTISLALRFNRNHVEGITDDMIKANNLSIMALKARDKMSYKACNDRANDAFGKYFFNMIAYSASSLWPGFFVLAWMQLRFNDVEFPFFHPLSLVLPPTGYFFSFLLCYILARIVFKNIRRYLPYFRSVQKMLDGADQRNAENMMTLAHLSPAATGGKK